MADKIIAKDLASKRDNFFVIDIREADEVVEHGAIEGSKNIPLRQLVRNARQAWKMVK